MKKLIAIVYKPFTALQYHRQVVPHREMVKFPDVAITHTDTSRAEDEKLKEHHVFQFLRLISTKGETEQIVQRLHRLGLKIWLDIDDYWRLPKHHFQYEKYFRDYIPQQTEEALRLADIVTCTTSILAEKIKPFNANVEVITNAVNPEEPQWHRRRIERPRLGYGWVGGVGHFHDIRQMAEGVQRLLKDGVAHNGVQICIAGFNHGNSDYIYHEQLLLNNYKLIGYDKGYVEYLKAFTPAAEHYSYNKPYRRIWGRDIENYGNAYNEFDVSLIPLEANDFTRCKSELKMIEAGMMGKAVICSPVEPYTLLARHEENCLTATRNTWYTMMRRLLNQPALREKLAGRLSEVVRERYDLKKTVEMRRQILERLCE